jgi:bifunctional non-homologous end joining protein LigD
VASHAPAKASSVWLGGAVITNPNKPFWPDEGVTKLELARFYAHIASQILPWMKGRA